MQTVVTAARLWDGTSLHENPLILIEDGRIHSITSRESAELPARARVLDYHGATIGPSFFDVHFHGAAGHDVMEATTPALETIGRFLASRGTAAYLATTVTAPLDATLRALDGIANEIAKLPEPGRARPLGIHLEGPFLSHEKRGVHPPDLLLPPSIATFDRLIDAAHGHVRLITIAPELPGAEELIRHAVSCGVRVSLGHSNATAAQTKAGIAAGGSSATHTFNAMRALDHREPGILGTVLTDDSLYADLICDGVHTTPEIVRLFWRAKGPERAILITDALAAAGMPDGEYFLGGFAVEVKGDRAMARGVLAGSVLTLDRALSNFVQFTGATVDQGLRLLTRNPAAMTGLDHRAGSIVPGRAANLVAVDEQGKLVASIIAGMQVN
ncbi:N-acetylglucosamine-6-phosphate deacetylase [Occallatibacter savannae]|uniref:N-acetylglucosamine-6-phosphate deacetylase n=1 Tax=Occallatibacter savannae TaxID=1002691 RepID=UPI000D68D865|nr:N-acetylglucosamine-6-phosphate deacetylase [Occallatibacter savannae]